MTKPIALLCLLVFSQISFAQKIATPNTCGTFGEGGECRILTQELVDIKGKIVARVANTRNDMYARKFETEAGKAYEIEAID